MPVDRSALGAFLRSRRDRLTPAQAGIAPFPGPRRVPGLRKEELAVLAGLSPDHYSRLEQGRQHTVSDEVVEALSRALRLDEVERVHLRDLAAPPRRRAFTWERPQRPDPGLLRVMTALDHVPALLLGRRSEILACNALLRAVLGAEVDAGSVLVRWLFLDPRARQRIVNWSDYAAAAVGALRYEVGRQPDDPRLLKLVDELRAADRDVARWWDDHGVTDRTSVDKVIDHPVVGPLTFTIEALASPHDPEQRLVLYTAEPNSPTAQTLQILASWGLEPVTTQQQPSPSTVDAALRGKRSAMVTAPCVGASSRLLEPVPVRRGSVSVAVDAPRDLVVASTAAARDRVLADIPTSVACRGAKVYMAFHVLGAHHDCVCRGTRRATAARP